MSDIWKNDDFEQVLDRYKNPALIRTTKCIAKIPKTVRPTIEHVYGKASVYHKEQSLDYTKLTAVCTLGGNGKIHPETKSNYDCFIVVLNRGQTEGESLDDISHPVWTYCDVVIVVDQLYTTRADADLRRAWAWFFLKAENFLLGTVVDDNVYFPTEIRQLTYDTIVNAMTVEGFAMITSQQRGGAGWKTNTQMKNMPHLQDVSLRKPQRNMGHVVSPKSNVVSHGWKNLTLCMKLFEWKDLMIAFPILLEPWQDFWTCRYLLKIVTDRGLKRGLVNIPYRANTGKFIVGFEKMQPTCKLLTKSSPDRRVTDFGVPDKDRDGSYIRTAVEANPHLFESFCTKDQFRDILYSFFERGSLRYTQDGNKRKFEDVTLHYDNQEGTTFRSGEFEKCMDDAMDSMDIPTKPIIQPRRSPRLMNVRVNKPSLDLKDILNKPFNQPRQSPRLMNVRVNKPSLDLKDILNKPFNQPRRSPRLMNVRVDKLSLDSMDIPTKPINQPRRSPRLTNVQDNKRRKLNDDSCVYLQTVIDLTST